MVESCARRKLIPPSPDRLSGVVLLIDFRIELLEAVIAQFAPEINDAAKVCLLPGKSGVDCVVTKSKKALAPNRADVIEPVPPFVQQER